MKEKFKSQKGIAFIAVIIVLVVAIVAGGVTYLGVRMLVTGENFLAPFEELGWIDSDKEDDEKEEKRKNKDDSDEEESSTKKENESNNSSSKSLVKKDRLSDEAKDSDVEHYYGSISMADSDNMSTSDEDYDIYKLLTMNIDMYAKDNRAVEIVFTVDMKDFLKKAYEKYGDEMGESGYSSYEEFEKEMVPILEDSFDTGLTSSMDDETSKFVETYKDNGLIQVYITREGFDYLYDLYEVEETNSIEALKEALEDSFGIKLIKE